MITADQYRAALRQLGVGPTSRAAAKALCCTTRQCVRYSTGEAPVPPLIETLLTLYLQRRSITVATSVGELLAGGEPKPNGEATRFVASVWGRFRADVVLDIPTNADPAAAVDAIYAAFDPGRDHVEYDKFKLNRIKEIA